jgi:integrase/recombinase XerD
MVENSPGGPGNHLDNMLGERERSGPHGRRKRNKLRVIDLNPFGGAVIFESVPPGIAKAPLFWHGKGERCANVSSRFASLAAELAEADQDFVRFRFHDLRHLHAVEWLRSGRSTACSSG